MSEQRSTDIMVSFGIGLLVGAVGALLLAPASGEETRKRLGQFGDDARKRLGHMGEEALQKTREGVETAKEFAGDQARRIERAVHEGKEAYLRETSKG